MRSDGGGMTAHPQPRGAEEPPALPVITPDCESHAEHALDEALADSFPSSDPVAIAIPKPSDSPLK
ncbi:hypothetical protein HH212_22625 [Massilia forsythiae]|uniref:Uncharacterized protein n=1 Tax=Massilia forsythiae TaxID=2728020 RepID=A0A7Z2ZUI9_9BURK|nr:hypothetical protein HH212_22625 [Massilia forsythiae]